MYMYSDSLYKGGQDFLDIKHRLCIGEKNKKNCDCERIRKYSVIKCKKVNIISLQYILLSIENVESMVPTL